ncbi:MAG: ATP-binding protein, partial [Oscillospiraceae bacterium]|nr:ATP-binding protein [Oscillospiraceae bacterium]
AVKHAEGDRLFAAITRTAAGTVMTVTNNGRPPKGPVAESGGLLSLRRSAEAAGGQMRIQSLPAFSLTLTFPE